VSERWTPVLEDFVDAASFILGAEPEAVRRLPGMAVAESALHVPFASFGGVEAYPTLIEQAAVLLEHLARNHPLPTATSVSRSS
jgi:death on curing protein